MDCRLARTRGPPLARDARTALRGGRWRATTDLPRALAHAPRSAETEVLHRHGRCNRAGGGLHVRVRLQPRVRAAPRPAPRTLPAARTSRLTGRNTPSPRPWAAQVLPTQEQRTTASPRSAIG